MNYICEQTKQGSWRVSASNPARVIATLLDEDDARLIAAAPELLEAAKNLLNAIFLKSVTPEMKKIIISHVIKIIAKAEGGK